MSDEQQTVPGVFGAFIAAAEEIERQYEQTRMSIYNTLNGYEVRVSPQCERGQVITGYGYVFMHKADAIRLKHPEGLAGSFAAADEYVRWLIEQRAAEAIARLEAM